jgi:hypothetical protein
MFAPLAGGITGFVDATLGWYISWIIGPGRPDIETDANGITLSIMFVIFIGVVIGFIGGLIA